MTRAETDIATRAQLPASLSAAAAQDLLGTVIAHRGQALRLDAVHVTMIGAQCAQILMAAQRSWQAEGQAFEVVNLTEDAWNSLGILGLSPEQIGAREVMNGA